jgi:hypothetical protein
MEKRYYSRCMYGNYKSELIEKTEIENKVPNKRFNAFFKKVGQHTAKAAKRFKGVVSVAVAALFLSLSLNKGAFRSNKALQSQVHRYLCIAFRLF